MAKQLVLNYAFNAAARTVTLTDFSQVVLGRLALITNVTSNIVIFNFADPAKGATLAGNVLTLAYDTTAMSNTDALRIDYDTQMSDPAYDKTVIGNARSKFRDGFSGGVDTSIWDVTNTGTNHLVTAGGNSSGSSYLRISLSPFATASEYTLTSKARFKFPMRVGFGLSMSQRVLGQEVYVGMIGCQTTDNTTPDFATPPADVAVTGATTVATGTVIPLTIANHPFSGGDRVSIYGAADSRLNVTPVVVTVTDANTISVPCTIPAATYSTTGVFVQYADPDRFARNNAGLLLELVSGTSAAFVARRNGTKFRSVSASTASSTALQSNVSPYTDAFNATANYELYYSLDEVVQRSFVADGVAGMSGYTKYTQGIPDEDPYYKVHIRARNLTSFTVPIARVTAISKSGTTTATVTTDVAHGLSVNDQVQVNGVRDQTNFANSGTAQVASITSTTVFTVVFGGGATASSAGGVVWRVQGGATTPSVFGGAVQSISRTNNVLTVIGNLAWATPLPGEYVQLHGLDGSGAAYEGAYKVLRVSTTTLELASTGADFTSINCGGSVIKRTDVRIHFARVMDYTRLVAEISGGRGNINDGNNAVPVALVAGSALSVTQSTGVSTTIWQAAGPGGLLVADVASTALTVSTTTAAIIPGTVPNLGTYANQFSVAVTAVSGTTPTLDLSVEESADLGVNWFRIYDFERITATGSYNSPLLRATAGNRYRYVQTVAGTTPSFTRVINRQMHAQPGTAMKRFLDRSIVLTTLSSVTPVYFVEGADVVQLTLSIGAVTTTAPALQLEGSETGITTDFYAIGAPLTGVASSAVRLMATYELPKFIRARVSTAGVGVTAGYVGLKVLGR